jgi:hypothetical protein
MLTSLLLMYGVFGSRCIANTISVTIIIIIIIIIICGVGLSP